MHSSLKDFVPIPPSQESDSSFEIHQKDSLLPGSLSSRANTSLFKDGNFNLEDRKLRKKHIANEHFLIFSKKYFS